MDGCINDEGDGLNPFYYYYNNYYYYYYYTGEFGTGAKESTALQRREPGGGPRKESMGLAAAATDKGKTRCLGD